jgi:hypothetical protein
VSNDPDWLGSGLDWFSFFVKFLPFPSPEIENSFQFHLNLNSNRRATQPTEKRRLLSWGAGLCQTYERQAALREVPGLIT